MNRTSLASLLALSLAACGGEPAVDPDAGMLPDAGGVTDAGPREDGAVDEDGGTPGDDGGTSGDDGGTPGGDGGTPGECGGARPDVSGIMATEGLVIARDGTIYYSQSGGVGRLVPGGAPQNGWVRIATGATVWGLALDAANTHLYFGSPSTGSVHVVDLTAGTPTAAVFVVDAGQPNGLTMGPDGALYYSDFGGDSVWRAETDTVPSTPTEVTASEIPSANGLVFLDDGTLLVASYADGTIDRLTLAAGAETARVPFAAALGSPDGIAVDADGRVYVTNQSGRRVVRLEADGSGPMTLVMSINGPANLEFGTGALDCEDLYITSSGAMRRYEMGTVAGAAVPWH